MTEEVPTHLTDTKNTSSDRRDVNAYGLAFNEIREEEIRKESQDSERQHKDETNAFCYDCLVQNVLCKQVACYLCYECDQYLCDKCFKKHESHNYINFMSEKSERYGQIESFLDKMRNESDREKMFEREDVSMVDRVDVKHELDQKNTFWITGLCGLDNTMWVVCDTSNFCIKILNLGSNHLQRCIRLWSKPWDVTEIKLKIAPPELGVISTDYISVTNQGEPLQSMLAITLPLERIILIIDVTKCPAVITKKIKKSKYCRSLDFNVDNMFALCRDGDVYDGGYGPWCVSVISTEGVTIKDIYIDFPDCRNPSLTVCPGRFYITRSDKHKVFCLNDKGKVVSHKSIPGSGLSGISVDYDTNHVYVCDFGHDKLYRLNYCLESLDHLFDFKSVNSDSPEVLCLYRNKLYISHRMVSTHGNFVTVVRVL